MSREERRQSRYHRPRRMFSWSGIIVGIVFGISGGVFLAWNVSPVQEFDTAPWQLVEEDRAHYVVAIMLAHAFDGDLNRTVNQLLELRLPGDPIQQVAEITCDLARTGYVDSTSGLNAVRSMMTFYQGQGKRSCADDLIPAGTLAATDEILMVASPTPQQQPTKTPTRQDVQPPTPTSGAVIVATEPPQSAFRIAGRETFCDPEFSGIIEIYVQNSDASEIPGQAVRVYWAGGESTFFTGLKPERGLDYADFQMEAGSNYAIEMPGRSDPSEATFVASPCTNEAGEEALTSYRVVFRPSFE